MYSYGEKNQVWMKKLKINKISIQDTELSRTTKLKFSIAQTISLTNPLKIVISSMLFWQEQRI